MDTGRLIKWVVIIVLAVVAWKYTLPWAKQQIQGHSTVSASDESSCVSAAQRASESWGGGLHSFVNPPYDLGAWSNFRSDVDAKISAAESQCRGLSPSDVEARTAMKELRSLAGDLDTSIRAGSPPPDDAVQRQEAIDTKIETAAALTKSGK
jgi:hypothetical protein